MASRTVAGRTPVSPSAYVVGQYVANLIGVAIVGPLFAWIVFGLFGEGRPGVRAVQLFLLLLVGCFAVIQVYTAIGNERRDLMQGRWAIDDAGGKDPAPLVSPWRRLGAGTVALGAAAALVSAAMVPLLGRGPLGLWTVVALAFLALLVASTPLVGWILPRDQRSFAAALARTESGAAPSVQPAGPGAYFLAEHFAPWVLLQLLINVGIGVKQFSFEAAKPEAVEAGGIPAAVVAGDFGIVFGLVLFFMWLASAGQVRPDVRVGRVSRSGENETTFSPARLVGLGPWTRALLVIVVVVGSMVALGTLATVAFAVAGRQAVSVAAACSVKGLAATSACAAGCALGVWWGREQESRLLREGTEAV